MSDSLSYSCPTCGPVRSEVEAALRRIETNGAVLASAAADAGFGTDLVRIFATARAWLSTPTEPTDERVEAAAKAIEAEVKKWPMSPNYAGPGVYQLGATFPDLARAALFGCWSCPNRGEAMSEVRCPSINPSDAEDRCKLAETDEHEYGHEGYWMGRKVAWDYSPIEVSDSSPDRWVTVDV